MILPAATIILGQSFKTINIDFLKTVKQKNKKEIVQGTIYFDGVKTTLKIFNPLNQWMILKGNEILIYYPDEQKAMRITSENPNTLPFFHNFLGIMKEDYGLSELGYTIRKNEMIEDTLFVHWEPPEKSKAVLGPIVVALVNDRIVLTKSRDARDKLILKTIYQSHVHYSGAYFPLQITMIQYTDNGPVSEEIVYSHPAFDKPLPPEILNFAIPEGIEVEEIAW